MTIQKDWDVKCPYCRVKTVYKSVRCVWGQLLVIQCEICSTEIDIKPTQETWDKWWAEIINQQGTT